METDKIAWLAEAARARDEARDYVERIWKACLREDEFEEFRDYWITDGKIRIAYSWKGSLSADPCREWREYPASLFESEDAAPSRAEKWLKKKAEEDRVSAEAVCEEWKKKRREKDLAELKRLKAEYEEAGENPESGRT